MFFFPEKTSPPPPPTQKKQISYVIENSYYFSRILRQICNILVMKNFQTQNRLDSAYTIGK